MKETLTVQRPALVDEFLENLMDGAREDSEKKTITFDMDHLNKIIQNIAIGVMRMQREAYEKSVFLPILFASYEREFFYSCIPQCILSYAMYYENLLKNQHMLLYAREREVSSLREQLKQKELETEINVHFQMSEQAHNLLLGKDPRHDSKCILCTNQCNVVSNGRKFNLFS